MKKKKVGNQLLTEKFYLQVSKKEEGRGKAPPEREQGGGMPLERGEGETPKV